MHWNTLAEQAAALKARSVSSVELTRHHLDRIERLDAGLNSFVTVTAEHALAQAEAADRKLAAGETAPRVVFTH